MENYHSSLGRLEASSRVGVSRHSDATLHLYVNGEDVGAAAAMIPRVMKPMLSEK